MKKSINLLSALRYVLCMITMMLFMQAATSQAVKTSKDFKYKLSAPFKVIDAQQKLYFNEGQTIISIKIRKKDFFIQKFDTKTMKEVSMREITDLPDGYVGEGFIQVTDKIIFFYSLWNKKEKQEQLFAREIDFDKANMAAQPTLLFNINDKLTGDMAKKSWMGYGMEVVNKFDFQTSFDSTMLVIKYRKKPEIKDDSKSYDVIGFNVYNYDDGLKKLWSKEVKMPYTEKKMDFINFTIDSEGNAYILAKVFKGDNTKDKDRDGNVNYDMELMKVAAATQAFTHIKISLPDKFISDVNLIESKDNNITIAGYYHKGLKKENGVEGMFISKLSKDGQVTDVKTYDIPLDIINQNVSKREAAKNKKKEKKDEEGGGAQLQNLEFRELFRYNDGSLMLIGEQYKVVEHRSTDSKGNVRVSYTYWYEDILVTKINADGNLAFMKRLPKTQTGGRGIGGMSFKHIESQNNHYFLFLDNVKNMNLGPDTEPSRHIDGAGGYLTAYKVDAKTGDVSKNSIFDTKNVNGTEVFQFAPSRIIEVSPTEFFLEVYKKDKEDVMVKLNLIEQAAQ